MPQPRLLAVLGSGGHASSVSDAAASAGYTVVGFIHVGAENGTSGQPGLILEDLDLDAIDLGLGMGTNFLREQAYKKTIAQFPNASFPAIVHQTAWVSPHAVLGAGVAVLSHSSVGPKCHLNPGALLNTGSSLDHDSTMGDFASLGPGSRTGGNVSIGQRSVLGLQAGILQGRTVGEDTVVGAHSLVIEDIPPLSVAIGTPCRVTRSRKWDENYY